MLRRLNSILRTVETVGKFQGRDLGESFLARVASGWRGCKRLEYQ